MNAEALREICLKFPHTTEEIKWENDLVFCLAGKMFCITSFEEPFAASFKVQKEAYEEWCLRAGVRPAPYLARAQWVQVAADAQLSKKEWENCLQGSYDLVKEKLTKKQKTEFGI